MARKFQELLARIPAERQQKIAKRVRESRASMPLEKLLEQCNPKARRSKQDRQWLDAKPVGGELI